MYDPGNQYAVNYMWGTTGIGYNVKKTREVLGADAKIDSWDVVFKPEIIAKFKDCGVHVLDAADDVFAAALAYLKLDPNTKEQADLEKAAQLLTKIRPFVRKFHSSEYSECARLGRGLPRARLFRRHQAGAEARRGSKERRRDRLRDPEGGRAALVRQSGDMRLRDFVREARGAETLASRARCPPKHAGLGVPRGYGAAHRVAA